MNMGQAMPKRKKKTETEDLTLDVEKREAYTEKENGEVVTRCRACRAGPSVAYGIVVG
jgi:hypothetical protein